MKRLFLLPLLMLPFAGQASAQTFVLDSVCIVGHGLSKHAVERNWPVPGADWQERNWGGGVCARWRTPRFNYIKSVGVTVGAYRNSLSSNAIPGRKWEWSQYVTIDADLLGWQRGRWSLEAGPMIGIVHGYKIKKYPVLPVVGVRGAVRYAVTKNVGISLVGSAHPTSFQKSKGVVTMSVRLDYKF